jgi:rRNA maturation endonuclease Nob1
MPVRPVLLKDLRRTAVQQHQLSVGTGDYNRYSPLDPRARTFSYGKRKLETDVNDVNNAPKTPRFDSSVVFEQLKGQELVLEEVKSTLGKLDECSLEGENCSPKVKEAFGIIGCALKLLFKSHENLTSAVVDSLKVKPAASNTQQGKQQVPSKVSNPSEVERRAQAEAAAAKKVKQAIREAEKKTILFNLDLGKVPTMNRDTLARKVAMAVSNKVNNGKHDYDIKDAEEVMDDILSCSKLEFLGTTTKTFHNDKNPSDSRNNAMCTMPVRVEFKDRDTRIQAETHFRKICGFSCSVPYPKRLRTLMNSLVAEGKKVMPNSFIRTRVNADNLTIDVHAKTSDGWKDLNLSTTIPLNICDMVTSDVTPSSQSASSQLANSQHEVMTIS